LDTQSPKYLEMAQGHISLSTAPRRWILCWGSFSRFGLSLEASENSWWG
jgi:hypothetical protein